MRTGWIRGAWPALLCALPTLAGCTMGGASFSVLNLKTGRTVDVRRQGHQEVLLRTDDKAKEFRTLYLADDHAHFIMRTIGYGGQILRERVVPVFAREYVAVYQAGQGYSLSPDGSSMVYLDEQTEGLRLLDLRTGDSRPLVGDLTSSLAHVSTIQWLSDGELLVAVDGTSKPYAQILVLDVLTGAVRVDLRPARLSLLAGVETDGTYLAYRDNSWNRKGFRIYDLRERREVGDVAPGPGLYAGHEKWASGGSPRLLYVERGGALSLTLREYDVAAKQSKNLRTWNSVSTVFVCQAVGTKLFYIARSRPVSGAGRLFVWDAKTQQETEIKGVRTNGRVAVVDQGERIIYEHLP